MRSTRWVQLRKADKMIGLTIQREWIARIKEENDGKFVQPYCSGCGQPLYLQDKYSSDYGFCSVNCGMITFGLSWSDFY